MSLRTLDQADAAGRRVLLRVDFNVPTEDGAISDEARLRAAIPTITRLRRANAKVVLLSHFDRPRGKRVASMSLGPIAEPLSRLIGCPVSFANDCVGPEADAAVARIKPAEVLLLENLRFHAGEEQNDPTFAAALAKNGDLFVNDAFSASHRAHASTVAIAGLLPAFAGEAMQRELEALETVLGNPARPVLGVVGGSKVSTKLELLRHLISRLDILAIGGGMANTFLFAQGWEVGNSYCEKALADVARDVKALAEIAKCELLLPIDIVVADTSDGGAARVRRIGEVKDKERILDAGPATVERLNRAIDSVRTVVWNGPLGMFETPPFDRGTCRVARHAAARVKAGKLIAVAGGGDTVAVLTRAGVAQDFSFISTAGGAFLQWMEGKELPGVTVLQT